MSAQNRIFRQSALDRLSSPDQLDRLIVVTDARGWIVAATLGLLLTALVAWGFLGTIPTNVAGKGILIAREGRVVAAMSPAMGQIETLLVGLGDSVEEGQPVARILQVDVQTRLENARELLAEREADLARRQAAHAREREIVQANLAQQRRALEQSIAAAREQAGWLSERLRAHQDLASDGFATRNQVQAIQTDLTRANQAQADGQSALLRLQAEENEVTLRHEREISETQAAIATAQRSIRELESQLARDAHVLAPSSGRVTEIRATAGNMVATGHAILGIESAGQGLEAVAYIPTRHGKMVQPGMKVRIAPDNVRREEHGTLQGIVRSISSFPSTREGMAAVLQNDALIDSFSRDGAPYEIRIDLLPGPTESGYAWSSRQGPPIRLHSGTTLDSDITVRELRPIDLIVPLFRKYTGLDG
ncbi:NHLP bacteriocin system secretion protein [Telmatospirillum sp. J64-1]|uniref:NHLP bacteriocin system secretion protein n=1 Tax=Telmatospirillum sp. J64-1 TaxID=2502183 RepID=UPI00163DA8D1|nr:NHLP bacteriocin system secretion protein [Telmatospirillum sp. J64-1]